MNDVRKTDADAYILKLFTSIEKSISVVDRKVDKLETNNSREHQDIQKNLNAFKLEATNELTKMKTAAILAGEARGKVQGRIWGIATSLITSVLLFFIYLGLNKLLEI